MVSHNRKGQNYAKLERHPGSKLYYKTRLDSSINFILPVSVLNPIPNKQDCQTAGSWKKDGANLCYWNTPAATEDYKDR